MSEEKEECTICVAIKKINRKWFFCIGCTQVFCDECMNKITKTDNRCPFCRLIPPEDPIINVISLQHILDDPKFEHRKLAYYRLAMCIISIRGNHRISMKKLEYLEKAEAYFHLGEHYRPYDKNKACEYYLKSIEIKEEEYWEIAIERVSIFYIYNREIKKAIKYLKMIDIEKNNEFFIVFFPMAVFYFKEKDYTKAFNLFNKVSNMGGSDRPKAKKYLAICYRYGLGVEKNEDIAFKYFIDKDVIDYKTKDKIMDLVMSNIKNDF